MSYNVTGFTIKKLDNFTLPYALVLKMSDGTSVTDVDEDGSDTTVTFDDFYASGMEIIGIRDGDRLRVTDISYGGEGSGTYWDDFEGLLAKSTGTLRRRMVWEGGDTVEIVTVTDGTVKREDV